MAKEILIAVHRAGNCKFQPNSLAAIHECWMKGHIPEVDIQLTQDKIAVLAHDDSIERICQGSPKLIISALTYSELMNHPLCSGDGLKHTIPKLEEIFKQMKLSANRLVLLDLKNDFAYASVFALANRYEVSEQIHFLAPSKEIAQVIRNSLPKSKIHLRFTKFSKAFKSNSKESCIDSFLYFPQNGLVDDVIEHPTDSSLSYFCELARSNGKKCGVVMLDQKIDEKVVRALKKAGVTLFLVGNSESLTNNS